MNENLSVNNIIAALYNESFQKPQVIHQNKILNGNQIIKNAELRNGSVLEIKDVAEQLKPS